ncbi:MAG TPA: sugar ABC transporter substrate-binding protein [Nocardioides sp.]|nr:sugar ABC transporter substrate-binding protein [Nocardioides sp.]
MHRNLIRLTAAGAILTLVSACGGDDGGGGSDDLRFLSLAWQEQSIAANKEIISQCNEELDMNVEYVQGDWNSAHDQLLTGFEGGDPPDIIHYEAAAIQTFAEGNYLADLEPMLSDDFTAGISDDIWETVQYEEQGTIGVPFLLESRLPIANRTLLEDAGIEVPTPEDPWTWDEFQDAAKQLTQGDTYGVAWPLDSPANAIVTLAQSFGGTFVDDSGDEPEISVGDPELEVPTRIHEMLYEDKSASPDTIGVNSTDALPGFFDGKYAMLFGASWLRQQMVEQAPKDFDWVTIPPLEGSEGAAQAVNPQILSVAAQSDNQDGAAEFIECFLEDENMAELALGDWLAPASEGSLEALQERTKGEQGWDVAIASAQSLTSAPWRRTAGFQEWMDRIATPTFQSFFADETSVDELTDQLEEGSDLLSEAR